MERPEINLKPTGDRTEKAVSAYIDRALDESVYQPAIHSDRVEELHLI
jgi:hypothetical protein